jgi:hypothetical protein
LETHSPFSRSSPETANVAGDEGKNKRDDEEEMGTEKGEGARQEGSAPSSMNWEFRIVPHSSRPGVNIVEVWMDGKFVATMSPAGNKLRLYSRCLVGHPHLVELVAGVRMYEFEFKPKL